MLPLVQSYDVGLLYKGAEEMLSSRELVQIDPCRKVVDDALAGPGAADGDETGLALR